MADAGAQGAAQEADLPAEVGSDQPVEVRAAPETSAEPPPSGSQQFERWLSVGGSIIAPATLLSTLLFYFGYVSSRAQYNYFGVDVNTIGLSTQDYVMRSPQPLLVPLLVLTLLGAALLAAHSRFRRRASAHPAAPRLARRMVVAGLAGLGVGVSLLFAYAGIGDWPYYPLVAPLALGAGASLTAYGISTLRFLDRRAGRPGQAGAFAGPGAMILLWLAVAASVFWATATVAQWSGLGLAKEQARQLGQLPSVIVDSQSRLFLPAGAGVVERDLTGDPKDQGYRYRYHNLRLLIQGEDRMFLVPRRWNATNTTLVVPLDASVRVQFQFRNDPP